MGPLVSSQLSKHADRWIGYSWLLLDVDAPLEFISSVSGLGIQLQHDPDQDNTVTEKKLLHENFFNVTLIHTKYKFQSFVY